LLNSPAYSGPSSTNFEYKFAILAIAAHCPSRNIFLALRDPAGKKGTPQKAVTAEKLRHYFPNMTSRVGFRFWQRVEPIVVKLLGDASPEVWKHARNAVRFLRISDRDVHTAF
jgi:hypothetical protein